MMPRSGLFASLAAVTALVLVFVPTGHTKVTVEQLEFLFDRPAEPIFLPKQGINTNKKLAFNVPQQYLTPRQKLLGSDVLSRFGEGDGGAQQVTVQPISLPDLSLPLSLDRRAQFSAMFPLHRKMAARLIEVFVGMKTLDDFMSVATYAQNNMNPFLFVYALSAALLHRKDTATARLRPITEIFPERFIDGSLLPRVREEANSASDPRKRMPLEIPRDFTATDQDEEHKLAYWREDLGVNLFHWIWHLVYPSEGPREVVGKDRRGELWYYLHQQIIARYNIERFSNNLQRVKRLKNLREPIAEGYFPKLSTVIGSRPWPPRAANAFLSDINRQDIGFQFDLQDMERWRDRIMEAIQSGSYIANAKGDRVTLTDTDGINVLGNMIEASNLSPNRLYYGDLHISGHLAVGFSHDPDRRYLESAGVIGALETSMRDPVFYRWHSHIDDIFQEHKKTLQPYSEEQLDWPGVRVTGLEVSSGRRANELFTFWQKSDVDVSRGFDFMPSGPVLVRFTHLQHRPYTLRLQIENTLPGQRQGLVRVYIAPVNNEKGVPMNLDEQRGFMIELDRFPVDLSQRSNTVERRSSQSSVTIPYARTFPNLSRQPNATTQADAALQFNICSCGWPQNLLIPKGTATGLDMHLFVMITDYQKDKVDQPTSSSCNEGWSYCGLRNLRYPDKRAMGFPFDRRPRARVDRLRSFLTPNMFAQLVKIKFQDVTEQPINSPASQSPQEGQQQQADRRPVARPSQRPLAPAVVTGSTFSFPNRNG